MSDEYPDVLDWLDMMTTNPGAPSYQQEESGVAAAEIRRLRVRVERAETILRKLLVPTRLTADEKAYLLTFSDTDKARGTRTCDEPDKAET